MELLLPCGDLEKLKIAIIYGADAVFIGGKEFSLRSRASNFSIEDIKEGVNFAHSYGKKVYVTLNIIPHNKDLDGLIEYIKKLEECEVDAVICASPVIYTTVLENTSLDVHISTQTSSLNSETIEFYEKLGVKRVVLGRELTYKEIELLQEKTHIELEVFIHGGMCSGYSGRCVLSNYMASRDANRGGCAHSCRWNYDLMYNSKKINENDYFSMASKDLMLIEEIEKLCKLKIHSLKVEGRMKSLYYIATVCRTYRMLLDQIEQNKKIDYSYFIEEIKKCENRQTSTGFIKNVANHNQTIYNQRSEIPTKEFVGIVKSYNNDTNIAIIEQRNFFIPGDSLEFFGPELENTVYKVDKILDDKGNELDAARHPQQILYIKVPFKLNPYDMIRKVT